MNRPHYGFVLYDTPVDVSGFSSVYLAVAGDEGEITIEVDGELDTIKAGATVKLPDDAKIITSRTNAPNNVTWGGIKKG